MSLDASQQAAVDILLRAPVCCITGGAGTGKTTCLGTALDRMDVRGETYLLASPTGKAARRMTEATGREASTIHRLLGYGSGDPFLFGEHQPLEADLVVIDEASMVDIELARPLFAAVQSPTRIALVGDANQLPSVGPGRVFSDLIASGQVPVARLTTLHRAAAESWVCSQAPVVLGGRLPDLVPRADFRWLEHEIRDHAVDALVRLVAGDVRHSRDGQVSPGLRGLGVTSLDDVQVLVPQNVGRAGSDVLNRRLQALLNPPAPGVDGWRLYGKKMPGADDVLGAEDQHELRVGDRVIQTRNDYELGVMNGETGIVASAGREELIVLFDEQRVTYTRDSFRSLRLAYALTVHKAQGSEWPWVVVLCHSTHTRMLERTWLYTAVTRARRGVVLIGDRVGLERAVKSAAALKRNTGLAGRLRERRTA